MTNCFRDHTWDEACKIIKKLGIKVIEIGSGGFNGKEHCNPYELLKDKDALDKFLNSIKKNGLEVSSLSCHGNPLHPDKNIANDHTRDIEASIELARKIGVDVVNCLAGCPGAGEEDKHPNWIGIGFPYYYNSYVKWQWEKKVIPFWTEMVKKAKKFKIRLGFEMLPGDVVYNSETLLKLRDELNTDEIAWNLDPTHLFWQGMDPIVCIKTLGNLIVSVHAQDTKINRSIVEKNGVLDWKSYDRFNFKMNVVNNRAWFWRIVGYGHGYSFWKEFVSALRIAGYEGSLSIEHLDPLIDTKEGILKSLDFLKMVIFNKEGRKKDHNVWFEEL
jgi:sugar phosphate isomerase/epimerase